MLKFSTNVNLFTIMTFKEFILMNIPHEDLKNLHKFTYLDCCDLGITDLDGIENFTELERLYCSGNLLTSIDLRKNKKLTLLQCSNNKLEKLNTRANKNLTSLNCAYNLLTHLDLSKNKTLQYLNCEGNKIKNLDLSANKEIFPEIVNFLKQTHSNITF